MDIYNFWRDHEKYWICYNDKKIDEEISKYFNYNFDEIDSKELLISKIIYLDQFKTEDQSLYEKKNSTQNQWISKII